METKEILNAFLTELLEGLKSAGALVSEQLPIVLQEYIAYGVGSNIAILVICLTVLGVMVFKIIPMIAKEDDDTKLFLSVFIAAPSIIVSVIFGINATLDLIKCIVAPRVYLIDQLKEML